MLPTFACPRLQAYTCHVSLGKAMTCPFVGSQLWLTVKPQREVIKLKRSCSLQSPWCYPTLSSLKRCSAHWFGPLFREPELLIPEKNVALVRCSEEPAKVSGRWAWLAGPGLPCKGDRRRRWCDAVCSLLEQKCRSEASDDEPSRKERSAWQSGDLARGTRQCSN